LNIPIIDSLFWRNIKMNSMVKKPAVSVIIPTYNRADLVPLAIQSVLDQTCQDFEIIVVDDASKDNTEEIVKNFKDDRIHYIRNSNNRGAAFSRNHGVEHAKGEYISFLDSDDYYLPNKLAIQKNVFKDHPDIGLVYSNIFLVKEGEENLKKIQYSLKNFKSGYLFEKIVSRAIPCRLPTWLIRKENYLLVGGFDDNLPMLQDRDFIVRFSFHYKLFGIPEPVAVVVYHKGPRISNNDPEKRKIAINIVLKKISKLVEIGNYSTSIIKKLTSEYYIYLAKAYMKEGDMVEGRSYLFKAVVSYPFSLKDWRPFLVSTLPFQFYKALSSIKAKINK